ncbi:MAG: PLP-dependent aspartate aminotransferase family protein [Anaerolineae bacterium]|nr:PLP-dependent aspartate aminotransferase family protein [Anaerolineae bacterium]
MTRGQYSDWRMETRAVHAGRLIPGDDRDRRPFIPTVPPIHPSVTYYYGRMEDLDAAFDAEGYVYARHGSPTVAALEEAVAALEEGETAMAFASGMAAVHAALLAAGARAGTAVVAARDLYGATYLLLDRLLRSQGVNVRFVDVTDLAEVEAACAEVCPVVLLVETVSNPLLKVADLPALAEIAHRYGAAFLVDNTFATPYLVRPLSLGADFVIHSGTKYLGGHGDVLAGVVVTSAARREALMEVLKTMGANLGPMEAWLLLRGLRTLVLRVERQFASAQAVARWLEAHPRIARVLYPGLPSHPQHDLALRLFGGRGFGGIVTFELKDAGREEVFRFMDRLRLCVPATSLGDVQTLVLYPARSSHRSLTPEERASLGITEGMVRISVGIEAVEDILADLEEALKG